MGSIADLLGGSLAGQLRDAAGEEDAAEGKANEPAADAPGSVPTGTGTGALDSGDSDPSAADPADPAEPLAPRAAAVALVLAETGHNPLEMRRDLELAADLELTGLPLWSVVAELERAIGSAIPDTEVQEWRTLGDLLAAAEASR